MSRLDHDRLTNLLAEAAALPAARRGAFLDSTCLGEPELRRELEELLACSEGASEVFDVASQHIVQPDPQRIGPYQILEPIGEGGMAIVYRAQQNHPVRRIVALKLIKLGMDTRQFVARFEAERQALAMMDHPNIAKVHDAGATETGRPYFVMEYVPGLPILEFCDQKKLNLRQRLELFMEVCDAVEHAHRNGIIHRDIKNSNVLVMEVNPGAPGVPKVIDFGVAKALSQRLTDRTLQTEQGQLIGTPEYMSPEQAERGALEIDTRSDVYSLGVLLYELISGVQPIPSDVLRSAGFEQVQRIIRETDPQRPSTRLSTLAGSDATAIAQRRSTPLPTLIRNLRAELEWIPLKAMRKDREQRYRSPSELTDDIRNYLDGRPLIAGPESRAYRARKFLRRHKTGVAASAAILLLLISGIVATGWQAVRASRAEASALRERDSARTTLEFVTDLLKGATPNNMRDVKLRQQIVDALIIPAADRASEAFKDRPLIEADVRHVVQEILRSIGRADLALPHAEAVLALRRRLLGEDHGDTISALSNYAAVLVTAGRLTEAEPLCKEAMERSSRVRGEDSPHTIRSLSNYAHVQWLLGRPGEAGTLWEQAWERYRRVLGEDHPDTMEVLANLASVRWAQGRITDAESLQSELLERQRRALGEDHPSTIASLRNYASLLHHLGRTAEAETLYKQALERSHRVLGEDHPESIDAMTNYAGLLTALSRFAEAEQHYKEALERSIRVLGPEHPHTIRALGSYAIGLSTFGRYDEAEPIARDALNRATTNPSLGPSHVLTRKLAGKHAEVLLALGRDTEAATVRKQFGLPPTTTQSATQPATRPN